MQQAKVSSLTKWVKQGEVLKIGSDFVKITVTTATKGRCQMRIEAPQDVRVVSERVLDLAK